MAKTLEWLNAELDAQEKGADPGAESDEYRPLAEKARALREVPRQTIMRFRMNMDALWGTYGTPEDLRRTAREAREATRRASAVGPPPPPAPPRAVPTPEALEARSAIQEPARARVEEEARTAVTEARREPPASPFSTGLDELKRKRGNVEDFL